MARKNRPRRNARGERVVRVASGRQGFLGPYDLPVPKALALLIGPDCEFACELTDEGLLYRKVSGTIPARQPLPEWLQDH